MNEHESRSNASTDIISIPLLGVNIDHVATLRNARTGLYPEPVMAALIAEQAGADQITIHVREDRRHINERDAHLLRQVVQTRLNLEMAPSQEMLGCALAIRPDECCLVPERRQELTTEGGLDVVAALPQIAALVSELSRDRIKTSAFIDPDRLQVDACLEAGIDIIELHTGAYAEASSGEQREAMLDQLITAAVHARGSGMVVNAGHGLHYQNVIPVASIRLISVLNIGHSIIARALFSGLDQAVREMKQLLLDARRS